jgi:hypothetical protein
MSDIITTPQDAAIEAIDDHVRQLNADIEADTRRVDVNTATRDRLLDVRASLVRKARVRKPRVVEASNGTPVVTRDPAVLAAAAFVFNPPEEAA